MCILLKMLDTFWNQEFLLRRDGKTVSTDNFWTLIGMALIFIVNNHNEIIHMGHSKNPKQISKKPTPSEYTMTW